MERHNSGSHFEEIVNDLFVPIQREYPYRFRITKHPRLTLQTGETVIPDFEIEIDLPHLKTKHLIECQDRGKNSKAILHKTQHIRSKSNRNKFIFVYRESASEETLKSLSLEGILVFSFEQLVQFAQQVKLIIGVTKPAHFGASGDEWDAERECEEEEGYANKPLEWTGPHQLSAAPPQAPGLPLRGSVSNKWSPADSVDVEPPQKTLLSAGK